MGCMFAIKKDLKMGDFCTKTLEVKKKRTRKKLWTGFPERKNVKGGRGALKADNNKCVCVCVCMCVSVCVCLCA